MSFGCIFSANGARAKLCKHFAILIKYYVYYLHRSCKVLKKTEIFVEKGFERNKKLKLSTDFRTMTGRIEL